MSQDRLSNPYKKFGIRRVINAATSLTSLGGSIPPQEMFQDMIEAGKCFVRIPELQQWAGKEIALATGAEAGLPTAGAVAGLVLATAACMMKGTELENYDPVETGRRWGHIVGKLPLHTEELKTEFIVQKSNRNSYDYSVELAGGHFKETGTLDGCSREELEKAYDPMKTAGYYYTARELENSLPLETVIEVAHEIGLPVVVDAAAEIPPKRKLKMYIEKGADLVVYSGGKHLAGPNNSGLLAGRADLVKLAHLQSYPFNGIGRAAKMSRETIVGLVSALKIYLDHDEEAVFNEWLNWAEWFRGQLGSQEGIETGIVYQNIVEDGEPMAPFCYLILDEEVTGLSGRELVEKLKEGDPCIFTIYEPRFLIGDCPGKMTINPQYMLEGEHAIVVDRIKEILAEY